MKSLKCLIIVLIVLGLYAPISLGTSLTMATSKSSAESGETITLTINGDGITGKVALSATGGTLSSSSVWVENSKSTATIKIEGNENAKITATPVDVANSSNGEPLTISPVSTTIKVNKKEEGEAKQDSKEETKNIAEPSDKEEKNESNNAENNNNSISTESNQKKETKQVSFKDTNETMYTSSRVNLRTNYGKNGGIYKTLDVGEEVVRTGYSTENVDGYSWSRVKYNGGTYYCITRSLTDKKPETKEEIKEEEKKEEKKSETTENLEQKEENKTPNEVVQTTTTTETDMSDLKKLEIVGYTISPAFSADVYEYKLEVLQDVSSLEVKTEAGNSNVQIDVAGNKDLKEGENVITVVCTNKETKKTSTYQIIVNKKVAENPHADAINEAMKKRNLIIKVGIGIIIVLVISCIIVFKKGKDEEDEIIEKKPKRLKERHYNEDEEKSNEEFKQLLENKKNRNYTDEELEEIRKKRIEERKNREKQARQNINNNLSNEDLPKGLQKEKTQDFSMANAEKIQRARDQEFDAKLERIRRERNNDRKGGKHF